MTEISQQNSRILNFPALLLIGGAMMIVGFGFKIAMAPFHIWTPDVYEGAPSPVTGFMAAGPKAAAFASFIRVFVLGFPLVAGAEASGYLHLIVDDRVDCDRDRSRCRSATWRRSCRITSNECSRIRRSRTPDTRWSALSAPGMAKNRVRTRRGDRSGRVLHAHLRRH